MSPLVPILVWTAVDQRPPALYRGWVTRVQEDQYGKLYTFNLEGFTLISGELKGADEGVTWARGWTGPAADALRTVVALAYGIR